jgi:hypothetical protein
MSSALFVVGQYPQRNAHNDDVADSVVDTRVVRCRTAEELVTEVARARAALGPLDQLDIVDHGEPGLARLGSDVLFEVETDEGGLKGLSTARAIAVHLSSTARVRLIHCNTAEGATGRSLLLQLARVFGENREVFGGIGSINEDDFDSAGFDPRSECPSLFSSEEAMSGPAVAGSARVQVCRLRSLRR